MQAKTGFKIIMIDWRFIDKLEGKTILHGYVPRNKKGEVIGKSGVTVATGFDIGQFGVRELAQLLNEPLLTRLMPYTGSKGMEAVEILKHFPLEITLTEALQIDKAVQGKTLQTLRNDWNNKSFTKFDLLPNELQTVLFSLCYNFGAKLSKSLPKTFAIAKRCAESKDYAAIIQWLRFFPSKNPELVSRRKAEADYLLKIMQGSRDGE